MRIAIFALAATLFFIEPVLAKKTKSPQPQQSPSSSGASVLSQFKTCKEANRAGVRNIPVTPGYTPPGWNHSADRDKDGIACEPKR